MRVLARTAGLACVLAVLLTDRAGLSAQGSSTLLLPPGYDAAHRYPVVVLLPFTSGGAGRLLTDWAAQTSRRSRARESSEGALAALLDYFYPDGAGRESFAMLLTGGSGREADYATEDAWSATIVRIEDELLADLDALAARYALDTTRVVLAGYSMGGDLAWALALRNPTRFSGAIVMGSGASYRTAASRMATLAARGARFFFTVGDHDDRAEGSRAAMRLLERHRIASHFRELVELGHEPARLDDFEQALKFVLWNRPPQPEVVDLGTGAGGEGRWQTVSAGASHACALAADGTAYCWGHNGFEGRLGDGGIRDRPYPAPVEGGAVYRFLHTTVDHTCGIGTDGSLACWGRNDARQLGDRTDSSRARPVRSAEGYRVSAAAAGGRHTCGLTTERRAYCWGSGGDGQLGVGERAYARVPFPVSGQHAFRALAAGYSSACGLEDDGTAWCWGAGVLGEGVQGAAPPRSPVPVRPPGLLRFEAITIGGGFACGLAAEGVAHCWGYNRYGTLGAGPAADTHEPVPVAGGLRFLSLDAGNSHACGVSTDHAVYCWGRNERGQLGSGTTVDSDIPSRVAGGLRFASVSSGAELTCGITTAGAAWCWGANRYGQLGNGGRRDSSVPVAVLNPLR